MPIPTELRTSASYRPALLWLMDQLGSAAASDVLKEFERRLGHIIPPSHRELASTSKVKWESHVYWSRHALVIAGLMGSGGHGVWTITEAGRAWLRDHPDGAKDALAVLVREAECDQGK